MSKEIIFSISYYDAQVIIAAAYINPENPHGFDLLGIDPIKINFHNLKDENSENLEKNTWDNCYKPINKFYQVIKSGLEAEGIENYKIVGFCQNNVYSLSNKRYIERNINLMKIIVEVSKEIFGKHFAIGKNHPTFPRGQCAATFLLDIKKLANSNNKYTYLIIVIEPRSTTINLYRNYAKQRLHSLEDRIPIGLDNLSNSIKKIFNCSPIDAISIQSHNFSSAIIKTGSPIDSPLKQQVNNLKFDSNLANQAIAAFYQTLFSLVKSNLSKISEEEHIDLEYKKIIISGIGANFIDVDKSAQIVFSDPEASKITSNEQVTTDYKQLVKDKLFKTYDLNKHNNNLVTVVDYEIDLSHWIYKNKNPNPKELFTQSFTATYGALSLLSREIQKTPKEDFWTKCKQFFKVI